MPLIVLEKSWIIMQKYILDRQIKQNIKSVMIICWLLIGQVCSSHHTSTTLVLNSTTPILPHSYDYSSRFLTNSFTYIFWSTQNCERGMIQSFFQKFSHFFLQKFCNQPHMMLDYDFYISGDRKRRLWKTFGVGEISHLGLRLWWIDFELEINFKRFWSQR